MTVMIERVAKAMFEIPGRGYEWSRASQHQRNQAREYARVILETIREPTDDMVEAGMTSKDDCRQGIADIYWSMIGCALGETE